MRRGNDGRKTVHISQEKDGQKSQVSLTDQEAAQLGFHSPLDKGPFPLAKLLKDLFGSGDPIDNVTDEEIRQLQSGLECSRCGLNYEDFLAIGRFGCGQCYESFHQNLDELMVQLHGANRHVGRAPADLTHLMPNAKRPAASTRERLDGQLREAIEQEDYERAAKLRDEIKALSEQSESKEEATGQPN
jgi:protein arginine kinase activator